MKRLAFLLFLSLALSPITAQAPKKAQLGGAVAPDGKTEIACDLPADLQRKNISSRGAGECVFTSIHHSAIWQNVPQLEEFPKWMVSKGIPGGGYPEKVTDLVNKISADRGLPVPDFINVEGSDIEILKVACRSGRMPGVTYGYSPTGRYNGQRIAHMVSLVHADDSWFCVLDNNYLGADKLEWMTPDTFRRVYTSGGGGWAVILLNPGPPAPPRN